MSNPEQNQDLTDVQIFEVGTHRGFKYTPEHLDQMVSNFSALADRVKPPLVAGHEEADGQVFLKNSGMPSFGWVKNVKREGGKLIASFSGVPSVLKRLISQGAFKRVSSEIYHDYKDGDKANGMTLRRVAILGGEIPQLKTLDDVEALGYDETPEQDNTQWVAFQAQSEENMSKDKVDDVQDEVNDPIEDVKEEPKEVAKTYSEDEVEALLAERDSKHQDELKSFGERLMSVEAKGKRAEIDAFVKEMSAEGRYLPKFDELGVVRFMETLDDEKVAKFGEGDYVSQLGCFQAIVRALPKAVNFDETAGSRERPVTNGRMSDRLHDAVTKYAEEHKVSYVEAMDKVRAANPDFDKNYE